MLFSLELSFIVIKTFKCNLVRSEPTLLLAALMQFSKWLFETATFSHVLHTYNNNNNKADKQK